MPEITTRFHVAGPHKINKDANSPHTVLESTVCRMRPEHCLSLRQIEVLRWQFQSGAATGRVLQDSTLKRVIETHSGEYLYVYQLFTV